ncbi:hypothetical protein RN001_013753 [Aquatica leii]|uniref:HORMA domain-containing protein n=1 Tax=Aquatica leii TaxID=1421715 RepID=A0AAN7SLQ8_9COLE|nr:hypothetical protein RN001_013753 [Aquatica leii]
MSMTKQKPQTMLIDPIMLNASISSLGGKVLIRKVIQIAIASILYERTDIDRNNFATSERNGVPYRVLKNKSKDPVAVELRCWLRGILDAFDKNYLKEVYLLFCDVNDETDVKESYKFIFKYFDNNAVEPEVTVSKKEIMESTDFLLRSINDLESFTKLKQSEVTPNIALTYYSDVTPMDYEPPHFKEKDEKVIAIMTNVIKDDSTYFYFGALKTKSCRLKCRGKGKLLTIPDPTNSEYTSVADTTRISSALNLDSENENLENGNKEKENLNESATVLSNDQCIVLSDASSELYKLQCSCGISLNFDNIEVVECPECGHLQHVPCLGYLYSSSIPIANECCSCRDNSFPSPEEIFKRERDSIYRLAVAYAYFNNTFPHKVLNELSQENKDLVLEKLLQIECIKKNDFGYDFNLKTLEEKAIDKLFPIKIKTVQPDSNNFQDDDIDSMSLVVPSKKLKLK